jgi:ribosomal protein S21
MAVNVEIKKTGTENNINIIRKFNRKVQGSGILLKARSKRYAERAKSHYTKKVKALKKLARRKRVERLIKLGKISDNRVKS